MVIGIFISNAVTLTANRCRNISIAKKYPNEILKLLTVDEIRAGKILLANSSSDNVYKVEVVFTVIPSLILALYQ